MKINKYVQLKSENIAKKLKKNTSTTNINKHKKTGTHSTAKTKHRNLNNTKFG